MAAITHHPHMPAAVSRGAVRFEKVLCATIFTLLPPVAFALLILSALLLALGLGRIL